MSDTKIKIALDWTPNTIHSGLYVAKAHGLYAEAGLDVELLPPDESYSKTPAKSLETGDVDLAICPSESVIAYAESNKPSFHLQAIYAVLQKDASAIISLKDGICRPRDLEDRIYGSYNARYEDQIVRTMVSNDGGDAKRLRIEGNQGKLSLFDELKKGSVDATWIFLPWEGTEAQDEALALQVFRTEEFGVPYGYSPVIARNANSSRPDSALSKFVQATRKGYEMAQNSPEVAVEALQKHCVPQRSAQFLLSSQQDINSYYSDGSTLGEMKLEKWQRWLDWLRERKLVASSLETETLFANL